MDVLRSKFEARDEEGTRMDKSNISITKAMSLLYELSYLLRLLLAQLELSMHQA